MYRDDNEALSHRVDSLSREADKLRAENQAIRAATVAAPLAMSPHSLPQGAVYQMDVRALPIAERSRLANHSVRPFPVWAVAILNVVTFGLFPLIHFGMLNDRLPRAAHNDPGAGKAIGFQFIPYFNLYWVFFSSLRICDRLDLQLRLRNKDDRAPKGLMIAASVLTVIPYLNILAIPIIWTIAVCFLQSTANKVAALSPGEWDATPSPYDQASALAAPAGAASAPIPGAMAAPVAHPYAMTAEQKATALKAQKFVSWSHLLGWGGLALLVFGSIAGAFVAGPGGAIFMAAISASSVVAGAVLGQVGRGMQGRAI